MISCIYSMCFQDKNFINPSKYWHLLKNISAVFFYIWFSSIMCHFVVTVIDLSCFWKKKKKQSWLGLQKQRSSLWSQAAPLQAACHFPEISPFFSLYTISNRYGIMLRSNAARGHQKNTSQVTLTSLKFNGWAMKFFFYLVLWRRACK